MLAIGIQVFRQSRRSRRLHQEISSSQAQRMRETSRAWVLINRLRRIDEDFADVERLHVLDGQSPMSEEFIKDLRTHILEGDTQMHGELKGLKQDIGDTLERIHSLTVIEGIWQRRLNIHLQEPFYRLSSRSERPKA